MSNPKVLRDELPRPIPPGIENLPRQRGYPVPWFVAKTSGGYDFRVVKPGATAEALNRSLCWICGKPLASPVAYVAGPMCAVNRTSAEPPSHTICADWSARACPFLTRPHAKRREGGLPGDAKEPAGIMLKRNPGVALVWITDRTITRQAPNGVLFDIGPPREARWYCEGRDATYEEVMESINTGLPALANYCRSDRDFAELKRLLQRAMSTLPAQAAV